MARTLYITLGVTCLALGAIGAVLPLLPTTPFVILAALCFSKGSTRLHRWLLANRLFGPMIRDWERHGVIPLRVKLLSTSMMTLMIGYPILFRPISWQLKLAMVLTAGVGVAYVWSRPSRPADPHPT